MTATEQFIEDAIKGGWKQAENLRLAAGYAKYDIDDGDGWTVKEKTPVAEILLDPLAWQAVGKTRGWEKINHGYTLSSHSLPRTRYNAGAGEWHYKWLTFIDHLADGKSIEEVLQALTN